MTPKISVLIPMYNRKHYIEQCINSVLNQTFQDFEIIVRDDGSTDGSADFVAQRYAAEISAGKIILKRNPKNLGETFTTTKLMLDSSGKYFAILHSDDMYLSNALENLYGIAEKYSADVVHSTSFLRSPPGGVIDGTTPLQIMRPEKINIAKTEVMPDDQFFRLSEFVNSSDYFGDIPHTFFRRGFFFDNRILVEAFCNYAAYSLSLLWWLLLAKVYVKTPEIYYIYRDAPDAKTHSDSVSNPEMYSIERLEEHINNLIEMGRIFDKHAAEFEIFRAHPEFGDLVKGRLLNVMTGCWIKGRNYYRDGKVSEPVRQAVERVFRKHFGENAAYPIFLFHLVNLLPYVHRVESAFINTPPQPT